MRSIAWAGILTVAMCAGFAGAASAGVKLSVKKASYQISGKTGAALLEGMDRRGPKHGFLTRAIAQTKYSVGWNITWAEKNGSCRVKKADALLSVTYTYPVVKDAISPQLRKRWTRFMSGVRKHEETHGSIARQMVAAAERSVSRLAVANDKGCRKAKAEAKKRVTAVYSQYEKRQILFDKKEHGGGGNVERLILGLKNNAPVFDRLSAARRRLRRKPDSYRRLFLVTFRWACQRKLDQNRQMVGSGVILRRCRMDDHIALGEDLVDRQADPWAQCFR